MQKIENVTEKDYIIIKKNKTFLNSEITQVKKIDVSKNGFYAGNYFFLFSELNTEYKLVTDKNAIENFEKQKTVSQSYIADIKTALETVNKKYGFISETKLLNVTLNNFETKINTITNSKAYNENVKNLVRISLIDKMILDILADSSVSLNEKMQKIAELKK